MTWGWVILCVGLHSADRGMSNAGLGPIVWWQGDEQYLSWHWYTDDRGWAMLVWACTLMTKKSITSLGLNSVDRGRSNTGCGPVFWWLGDKQYWFWHVFWWHGDEHWWVWACIPMTGNSNTGVGLYSYDRSKSNTCVGLYSDGTGMSNARYGPVFWWHDNEQC